VVLLVDYLRTHQGWGWMRLVQGAAAFKDTPGLLFTKVMGSGHEGGFVLRPLALYRFPGPGRTHTPSAVAAICVA
jgi:hypothetical protein